MTPFRVSRRAFVPIMVLVSVLLGAAGALVGLCGPFTDVTDAAFCPFVLEIFYLGVTTGTTPTTYDPTSNVTRLQMATFLSRSVDGLLKRGSRRAALEQFWTPQNASLLGSTTALSPYFVKSDGEDLWVAGFGTNSVTRIRASSAELLEIRNVTNAHSVLIATWKVWVTGATNPGWLYKLEPSQAGYVQGVATALPAAPHGLAFDGSRIWTANSAGASVSIITPGATLPWTVTTVTLGFTQPEGMVFDGANVWVTDLTLGTIRKLAPSGAILQTVTVGGAAEVPLFDGNNIWVPSYDGSSISVVRPATGAVLATLTGNGLAGPVSGAFDGQRVLFTNLLGGSVSLWKAADLMPLGSFPVGPMPLGACSDGVAFFVTTAGDRLVRF